MEKDFGRVKTSVLQCRDDISHLKQLAADYPSVSSADTVTNATKTTRSRTPSTTIECLPETMESIFQLEVYIFERNFQQAIASLETFQSMSISRSSIVVSSPRIDELRTELITTLCTDINSALLQGVSSRVHCMIDYLISLQQRRVASELLLKAYTMDIRRQLQKARPLGRTSVFVSNALFTFFSIILLCTQDYTQKYVVLSLRIYFVIFKVYKLDLKAQWK